jgi:ABC-type polysaccharide/polyol phosphate transport system ATPase subunit
MEEDEVVIRINNVSKEFAIKNANSPFFALKDVSFDVKRGDVISIIGNNGSGKTTLLRILSNITKPSKGEILLYGSSTSILDIGGNFHPDLTGRENVYLQLKLAGKDKAGSQKYAQEVLEFSEIGGFFDQPVKHYSSGMFLRLAFSLAFHIASDILILDEVLSVGDEGFRLKCQELLRRFAESGKTIVFVSHNRHEILELSNKCMWLESGQIKKVGLPAELLGEYFANHRDNHEKKKKIIEPDESDKASIDNGAINMQWSEADAPKDESISIREVSVSSGLNKEKLLNSDPILLRFLIHKKVKAAKIGAFFFLQDIFYQPVLVGHMLNNQSESDLSITTGGFEGMIEITCTIPADFLIPGKYYLLLRFGMEENEWNNKSKELFRFNNKLSFTVYQSSGRIDLIEDISKGAFRPKLDWRLSLDGPKV